MPQTPIVDGVRTAACVQLEALSETAAALATRLRGEEALPASVVAAILIDADKSLGRLERIGRRIAHSTREGVAP